jgi:hypothetical protein
MVVIDPPSAVYCFDDRSGDARATVPNGLILVGSGCWRLGVDKSFSKVLAKRQPLPIPAGGVERNFQVLAIAAPMHPLLD